MHAFFIFWYVMFNIYNFKIILKLTCWVLYIHKIYSWLKWICMLMFFFLFLSLYIMTSYATSWPKVCNDNTSFRWQVISLELDMLTQVLVSLVVYVIEQNYWWLTLPNHYMTMCLINWKQWWNLQSNTIIGYLLLEIYN